jgi:hypothetical protein
LIRAGFIENERGWRYLLYALTLVMALIYLSHALFEPGTFGFAPQMIQDDARQFLTWMSRLDDAAAMPGDLLADYWQSVSPPLYRSLFAAANALGIEPTLFARLLPVPLLFFCAWMAWRVSIRTVKRPVAAFVAAAFVVGFLGHDDSIYSATPRAFSAPLFLLFLDGLLRDRGWVMIPALFLLGLLYPATAVVALSMWGLSRIGWRPFRIDLSARTWLLGGLGAGALLLAILPLAESTERWDPTLSLSEALALPNLGTPEGRSSIVGIGGSIDYLCSARMGVVPEVVPCWLSRASIIPNLLLMVPMLLVAAWAIRRTRYQPGDPPGELIYGWALVAAVAWWALAVAVAFHLHLPSRYTQRTLSVLEFLAIGQMLGLLLDRGLRAGPRSAGTVAVAGVVGVILTASTLTPTPGLHQPNDPAAIDRIAALPAGTIVGGVSDQLDFVPALTGKPTLAAIEHSIPYHSGYFTPVRERLEGALAAVSSPDARVLGRYVRDYRVQVIALDRPLLDQGRLPERWKTVVPGPVRDAEEWLRRGPSALQQKAASCLLHDGALVLLDARCLTQM